MMAYKLSYHYDIPKDLSKIPGNIKKRIRKAIEQRLLEEPLKYGEPLKRSLHGYWKLRVSDYRIIYKIEKENIIILKIGHKHDVYAKVDTRL